MTSTPLPSSGTTDHLQRAVRERYSEGASRKVEELCCPVLYDPALLEVIPDEVVERDYGCGDPTRHICEKETVLDLGSGTGKSCFIAAQIVGPQGLVIGVDMNEDMLDIARRAAPVVAERLDYANVRFHKGRIEDLALDMDALGSYLTDHPISSTEDLLLFEEEMAQRREKEPMIPESSVDVVISNCVLNLVLPEAKKKLFKEIYRVLKPGGRAVISDIVSDQPIPETLATNPELWSGCIAGAFQESAFLSAFAQAGFSKVEILERSDSPWREIDEIAFRSLTVRAQKETEAPVPSSAPLTIIQPGPAQDDSCCEPGSCC